MTTSIQAKAYGAMVKEQQRIARSMEQMSLKLQALGTISNFDRVTKKGRSFARRRGITKRMVLKND